MNKLEALNYLIDNFNPPYLDEWIEAGQAHILREIIKSDFITFDNEYLDNLLKEAYKN